MEVRCSCTHYDPLGGITFLGSTDRLEGQDNRTVKVIIFLVSCSKLVKTSSSVFIKERFLLQLFGSLYSTQIVIRVRYQLHVF